MSTDREPSGRFDPTGVPELSVVVLTWNDASLAREAIDSVLASQGVSVRVIVVDNGSKIPFAFDGDDRVHVIRSETNLGVAAGRNVGTRAANTPIVAVLDSDAAVEPDCFRLLLEAVQSDRVGLAAPVIVGQEPEQSGGASPSLLRKLARGTGLTSRYKRMPRSGDVWQVEFAIGACQVYRREAFDEVGGMPEEYPYGLEDLAFCDRFRRAGWNIVQVESARCRHALKPHFKRMFSRRGARHGLDVVRYLRARRG